MLAAASSSPNNNMKNILRKILFTLSRSSLIYKASKKIVDFYRNENNCEIETNGELDFIKTHGKDFVMIFDVGANIGEWTNLTSALLPNSTIYSFEPSASTFATLRKNTEKLKNAHIQNIGLGAQNEQLAFFEYGDASVLSSAIKRDGEIGVVVETKANFEKLDTFCEKNRISHISFLKIDTEGNELAVLNGGVDMIGSGNIDAIQFEYGGTYIDGRILLKDIFDFFKDKPYAIYKLRQHDLLPCPNYSQALENFQYANYVALLTNKYGVHHS